MTRLVKQSVIYAWIALVLLTALSWYLSVDLGAGEPGQLGEQARRLTASALLLLAFFKVRLVIMHFMEVATAPLPLRMIMELWVLAVCGVLLAMYWLL